MIAAVVFDLDGILVDTEQVWDEVRERLVADWDGHYSVEAQRSMMGMSSPEWSRFMHDELGLEQPPEEINAEVVRRMLVRYEAGLPLVDGAVDAVHTLAGRFPLAVASSSNRPLIDAVLAAAGIADLFTATVSSEEVARGKPAPDVYLEAARRLGLAPESCAAIEDSGNGLRAAHAAGMRVIAVPSPHYPPPADTLALADVVLESMHALTPDVAAGAGPQPSTPVGTDPTVSEMHPSRTRT